VQTFQRSNAVQFVPVNFNGQSKNNPVHRFSDATLRVHHVVNPLQNRLEIVHTVFVLYEVKFTPPLLTTGTSCTPVVRCSVVLGLVCGSGRIPR
jgi:hypothetical protein